MKKRNFADEFFKRTTYMTQNKKFISPGAWFSMLYPATWSEFEDGEGSFLFYNPDEWTGNFRISAFRGGPAYGLDCVRQELADNPQAMLLRVGDRDCAYSREHFTEDGVDYTTHFWIMGQDDVAFECSFTVARGMPAGEAVHVIETLQVRRPDVKYPAELIPVRLSEICQIDAAYEWVERKVKDVLKTDFQGTEEDIARMQQLVDQSAFSPRKREVWTDLGIVLCVILANEVDGLEWQTLVDGNREAPVLVHAATRRMIDPMKLVWSRVKAGEACRLAEAYEEAMGEMGK